MDVYDAQNMQKYGFLRRNTICKNMASLEETQEYKNDNVKLQNVLEQERAKRVDAVVFKSFSIH